MNKMVWMISNNWILKCSFVLDAGELVASVRTWSSDEVSLHSLHLLALILSHPLRDCLSFTLNVLTWHFSITILQSTFILHVERHWHLALMFHTLVSVSLHSFTLSVVRLMLVWYRYSSPLCSCVSGCHSWSHFVASHTYFANRRTNCYCDFDWKGIPSHINDVYYKCLM